MATFAWDPTEKKGEGGVTHNSGGVDAVGGKKKVEDLRVEARERKHRGPLNPKQNHKAKT